MPLFQPGHPHIHAGLFRVTTGISRTDSADSTSGGGEHDHEDVVVVLWLHFGPELLECPPLHSAKLSIQQLKRAVEIKQAIADLETQLGQLLGGEQTVAAPAPAPASRKRKMSAAAKARISVAQKARWAERNKGTTPEKASLPAKNKGKMSAEGRARIIAATKARWARYNAEKKKKAAA